MNKADTILVVGLAIAIVAIIGLVIWDIRREDREVNRRMSECFERVDDPKWCFENIK